MIHQTAPPPSPSVETSYEARGGVPEFETAHVGTPTVERVSLWLHLTRWSAIVAGAFSAISVQIVFAVLGTAIGLSVIGTADNPPAQGLSIGAGIWWLVTGLISLYFGGLVAGHLAASADRAVGAMHGFLSWCTVTVLSTVLLAMAGGSALGGSLGIVSHAANNRTNEWTVSEGRSSVSSERDSRMSSSQTADNVDRQGLPLTESERKVAARNAAGASWWTVLALVLGAAVASIGGTTGACACGRQRDLPVGRQGLKRSVP